MLVKGASDFYQHRCCYIDLFGPSYANMRLAYDSETSFITVMVLMEIELKMILYLKIISKYSQETSINQPRYFLITEYRSSGQLVAVISRLQIARASGK